MRIRGDNVKGSEILCEKCGSTMRTLDPQKPIGMTCDKCGWGWTTTFIEPIYNNIQIRENELDYSTITLDGNPL